MKAALAEALQLGADELDTSGRSETLTEDQIAGGRESFLYAVQNIKSDYVVNWHHDQLAGVLERVQRGEIRRLIVLIPPRCGKSEMVSRQFPPWVLGKNPDEKIIACSYSATLARRMGSDVQKNMRTDEYQAMFSTQLKSTAVTNKKNQALRETCLEFEVVGAEGEYIGAGVGGPITGSGFSLGIIDDYCKNRKEAESQTWRDSIWDWYTSTFYSRREGKMSAGGTDRIVICATPWHEDDLIGRVLSKAEEMGEEWHIVRFPAIKEEEGEDAGIFEATDPGADPRETGEALWPDKFDLIELGKIEALSPADWSSLNQLRPGSAKGNIFERSWWRDYTELPKGHLVYTFSLDCAFKDGNNSSFVALHLWANRGPDHYLVDRWKSRIDFEGTKDLCDAKFGEHEEARTKLIEAKANGPAIISSLKRKYSGLVAVEPKGSKVARAMGVVGVVKSGNVHLPKHASWREAFVDEHAKFPFGKNDDDVDAMTQYLEHGPQNAISFLQEMTSGMM